MNQELRPEIKRDGNILQKLDMDLTGKYLDESKEYPDDRAMV